MLPALANTLWLATCLPEYRRFHRAAARVACEQAALLQSMIAANANTEFGRLHGFSSIRCPQDYQKQIPLSDYESHEPWILRSAAGEKNVITCEPIRLFEPTSGSTSASKLVPYTRSLQQQFQRSIQAWIADLFLRRPELLNGRAYWSVSPAAGKDTFTSSGIPIGFENDSAYLGGWQQRMVESVMAVLGILSRAGDIATVQYLTLLFLIRCRNLKLISVWNPTFLSLLMEHLPLWGDELAWDIEKGTISRTLDPGVALPAMTPAPRRAQELREALRMNSAAESHLRLWPGLRLISCWVDANAAAPAATLQALFPQAEIQGKGLIATEAFMSFPLHGCNGSALAIRSHFFEFIPIGRFGMTTRPLLAHELELGCQYEVVVTNGGGLYRYRMGDVVEVTGRLHECPLIRFMGRHNHVSDWFGEKLNEAHVAGILRQTLGDCRIESSFAMLACDTAPRPAYVLYIDTEAGDNALQQTAENIETALCANFHYQYARHLGQLGHVRIFRARQGASTYLANAVARGQRAGDVKPLALDHRTIWSKTFAGDFVDGP